MSTSHNTLTLHARATKALHLAKIFHDGGLTPGEVAEIQPKGWKQLHSDLKRAGALKPHSTVPSDETIALTLLWLGKLRRDAARPMDPPANVRRRRAALA